MKNRRLWFTIILALIIVAIPLIWNIYLSLFSGYSWGWVGVSQFVSPSVGENQVYYRQKTLWDLLELLIVPAVLAIAVVWFDRSERKTEREIAKDRIQEAALQTYIDRMTELLLEKGLRASQPEEEIRVVATVRTLTILRGLDATRKGTVVNFLYDSKLIQQAAIVKMEYADLEGVDLFTTILMDANLKSANLKNADLFGANLESVNMDGAYLRNADLSGAKLDRANLKYAVMMSADLRGASLNCSNMSGADLEGADLEGANLYGAIVTMDQWIMAKSLKCATMPDGKIYDPAIHGPTRSSGQ